MRFVQKPRSWLVSIVFFKRLGSRHTDKEIKLPKCMNGNDMTLGKTELKLI